MNLKDFKKELLQNPEFRKEYYRNDLKLSIAFMVEKARVIGGITQKGLAKKMKTKQSAISRVESGDYLLSLSFLERMAKALGTELIAPQFAFLKEKQRISIDEVAQLDPATLAVAKLMKGRVDSSVSAINTIFFEMNLQK